MALGSRRFLNSKTIYDSLRFLLCLNFLCETQHQSFNSRSNDWVVVMGNLIPADNITAGRRIRLRNNCWNHVQPYRLPAGLVSADDIAACLRARLVHIAAAA